MDCDESGKQVANESKHDIELLDSLINETGIRTIWENIRQKILPAWFSMIEPANALEYWRVACAGVTDHAATLSIPRCQVIDLCRGALTDLRCTAKCKCKSSLTFPLSDRKDPARASR